ncbi:MAG TPA: polyribonucleotide nucleotidyltransferase [Candidatus Sulfotelmatobacter sp.]|jgi:polyribonucleotide nucleotidyltransferase|nr:polyribonucleotide nucleotidyltransferase [Candidatus Sulfotelmatobacter sp.]
MNNKKTTVSIEFAGKTLSFETGELAPQATASVLARLGDTMVLITVVEGVERSDIDYFPLSVEYVERLYAGGKIKGSRWVKREGRPSDEAILAGRLIDRSIRPLFPKSFKKEVQVIVTVLSVDAENAPDIIALNGVSAALAMSRIPWKGPIGAIRMGYVEENGDEQAALLPNPTVSESVHSVLDIVVSQSKEKTVMIEAGALQVPEAVVAEAIQKAHIDTQRVISGIEELVKKAGQEKLPVPQDESISEAVHIFEKSYKSDIAELVEIRVKKEGGRDETGALVDRVYDELKMKDPQAEVDKKSLAKALELVMFKMIRADVVNKQKRVDGRKIDELRNIFARVGILPRTHGSALFNRGITQALSVVTLASPRLELLIESAEGEEKKRYIHHYSGLPYSFGQAGRVGFVSRREIGHGALAERALKAVIPDQSNFPYTIRVVSEVLSQNGSSSMASTCGSTLALMDAGVPIIAPVAGISIGRMSEGDKAILLTDIIGLEDFSGDMDFKVAGTEKGITAIQLDVKIDGLRDEEVVEILARARTARMQILEKMLSAISQSRAEVSEYAPKISVIQIPTEKIGEVIGPGGKSIRNIIAQTGADVDIDDDGNVTVSGVSEEAVKKAIDWISGMTREVTPGEEFEGEVKRILPFGAFVEYLPGREGMVHVSKMRRGFVKDPSEVVSIGDQVKVKVEERDAQGRINLTMLLGEDNDQPQQPQDEQQPSFDRPAPSFRRDDHSGRRPFERRGDRPGFGNSDRPVSDRPAHPLSQQLRRENEEKNRGPRKFGPKKRFSR